jgi:hypothetical protein
VRSVQDRSKDGRVFMRQYQVEIKVGKDEVLPMIVCDYDIERRFEVGKITPVLNVRPAISDFKNLHIEFHVIGSKNGNKPAEEKKVPNVKV